MSGAALSLEERYKFQLRKHQLMVDYYVEKSIVEKKIENADAALNYCYHLEPRFRYNLLFKEQFLPTHQKRWKQELLNQARKKKEHDQSNQTKCDNSNKVSSHSAL